MSRSCQETSVTAFSASYVLIVDSCAQVLHDWSFTKSLPAFDQSQPRSQPFSYAVHQAEVTDIFVE